MNCFSLSCLLFLLSPALMAWEEPRVSSELSTGEAFLGDVVIYTVRVTYPDGWSIEPELLPEKVGEASVISQQWSEPEQLPDSTLWRRNLTAQLSWYRLGEFEVPQLEVTAIDPGGSRQAFKAPALGVQILHMLAEDDNEIAPAKDQVDMSVPPLWPWILAAVLLLALIAGVLVYYLGRRGKDLPAKPALPPMPPYDEAIARLRELTHGSLLKEGRTKEFHVAINQIVRHYYARLFHIHAEEMTSFEMEEFLAVRRELPEGAVDLNQHFQERCDLVKFAKHEPLEAETKQVVNAAYEIVEKLKPQDEPINEEGSHVAVD